MLSRKSRWLIRAPVAGLCPRTAQRKQLPDDDPRPIDDVIVDHVASEAKLQGTTGVPELAFGIPGNVAAHDSRRRVGNRKGRALRALDAGQGNSGRRSGRNRISNAAEG